VNRPEVTAQLATESEESLGYEGWPVVAASGAAVFCTTLVFFTFAVLLKPLTEELGWSRGAVSTAFACLTLGAALSAPVVGQLFDRFGPARISGPCLAIVGVAFASLSLLTPRLPHLYAVYLVIGLATTGTSAVVYSRAISSWFDRRRGTAIAVVMASAALGSIVHPPLATVLTRRIGWRGACLVLGGLIVVAGVPLVARFVRERPATRGRSRTDTPGATLREALASKAFWILITVVFGSTLTLNSTIVHLAALLTDRGIPSSRAAIAVSAMGAASLAGRLLTGWLLDRFAATRVSFALLASAALGTFLLGGADSFAAGVLAAAFIGFGTGGELDVVPLLLSRYFGLRSLATLYGLNWTAWGVAGAVGPILMGRAFDASGSYDSIVVGFAAVTLAAATLVLALPVDQKPPGPQMIS
jgi:predicted MFS family arabinose efflux permease